MCVAAAAAVRCVPLFIINDVNNLSTFYVIEA